MHILEYGGVSSTSKCRVLYQYITQRLVFHTFGLWMWVSTANNVVSGREYTPSTAGDFDVHTRRDARWVARVGGGVTRDTAWLVVLMTDACHIESLNTDVCIPTTPGRSDTKCLLFEGCL